MDVDYVLILHLYLLIAIIGEKALGFAEFYHGLGLDGL